MIKKTIITLFILFMMISCGKKGDPEYKKSSEKNKKTFILKI